MNRELKGYIQSLEKARLRDGIRHLFSISRHGNVFMQVHQPWVLLKGTDDQKTRAGSIIGLACNLSCLLANLLFPYMPDTARNLFKQLNIPQGHINPLKPQLSLLLSAGHKIGVPSPLFAKIEPARAEELKKRYGGVQQTTEKPAAKQELSNKLFSTVAECEKAVADQGEKVRQLKTSGVEKTLWQPEVTILLELKKQLTALQAKAAAEPKGASAFNAATPSTPVCTDQEIKALETEVTKQVHTYFCTIL